MYRVRKCPWNDSRVKHLYSRLGYGASKQDIANALSQNPVDLINSLLDNAYNKPLQDKPIWADWNPDQFNEEDETEHYQIYNQFTTDWINYTLDDPIRRKCFFLEQCTRSAVGSSLLYSIPLAVPQSPSKTRFG